MIKRHLISGDWTSKEVQSFIKTGVKTLQKTSGYMNFIVEEGPQYEEINQVLIKHSGKYLTLPTSAIFSNKEINDSKYLAIGFNQKGYPQPQDINKYREDVFKINCQEEKGCGYKEDQINHFRIKQEPKWKKNEVLFTLNWEFDSIFAQKEFYTKILKPLGIGFKDVIIHRTNKIAQSVVQLVIPISNSALKIEDSWYNNHKKTCLTCGKTRYQSIDADFLPSFIREVNLPLFQTQENFGSGALSYKKTIISKELAEKLHNSEVINKYLGQPFL